MGVGTRLAGNRSAGIDRKGGGLLLGGRPRIGTFHGEGGLDWTMLTTALSPSISMSAGSGTCGGECAGEDPVENAGAVGVCSFESAVMRGESICGRSLKLVAW